MIPGTLLGISAVALLAGLILCRNARFWLAVTLAAATTGLLASLWILFSGSVWEWRGGFALAGETVHLRLDALSSFFLALVCVLGGAASAYSHEYWPDARHPRSAAPGRAWWNAMLLCMGLVLVCANGLHFLIAWELFAVTGYFLITLDRQRLEVRQAGWLYLVASHAGTLCLFGFFAGLASRTGGWDLGPMRDRADLAPLFWLALVGFGLKAGLFPLHIWLPSAHANAPTHVSAILSGVAIKMGVYGLFRFSSWLAVPDAAGVAVLAAGVVSAVLGVAFALGQHDLKRLLAYHSVENIGIILIGLGFALVGLRHGDAWWGKLAFAGGLLHVWNHGLFKGLLFLGAGSVLHATGTREMSRLGGLWRSMPWTAGTFTLGAAAICGLPPLNGFISEWLVYLGLFGAVQGRTPDGWLAAPAAVCLAITGALALACFVKVVGVVFLGAPRTAEAKGAHESGPWMRFPMLVLAALCVLVGLAPVLVWPAVQSAAFGWSPSFVSMEKPGTLQPIALCGGFVLLASIAASALLWRRVRRNGLRRAPTWDCGYAAPTARMQYTAGSFAGIITGWFAWILRPERHEKPVRGVFPTHASLHEHTPETVLDKIISPFGAVIMRVSTAVRGLQHGRVQSYILYLALGLAVLSVLAYFGGAK